MLRVTVIGGGPGGYTAAFAAARMGCETTLIERSHLGGTCLNYGCIPTKTLRASADALEIAHRLAEFGIQAGEVSLDPSAVLARMEKVRTTLRGGLEKSCAHFGVRLLRGQASFVDAKTVRVQGEEETLVTSDAVIIATGSKVAEIPAFPFDGTHILSSDHALSLSHVPARLAIVGGGVVGCELACIYRAFGAAVTVIEGQQRLLPIPSVDADISAVLQREMKKKKIALELGRTLKDVRIEDGVVRAVVGPSPFIENPTPVQSKETALEADMLLVTIGRAPATDGLALDNAQVRVDARGWIEVNETLETSTPGIYAIGDVLGPSHVMLAHVAAVEGLNVVRRLCGKPEPLNYAIIPSGIFTSPEIGCVGLSEAQAREQGFTPVSTTVQMRELGKAQAMGELPGFFKLIADQATGKLLGAHIAGAHASDLVAEAGLALQMGATASDVAATIHAHPTLAEGFYEAALHLAEQHG